MFKKNTKKTLSEKAVSGLQKQARKRHIGNLIGLNRNDKNKKAIEEAFNSSFNN